MVDSHVAIIDFKKSYSGDGLVDLDKANQNYPHEYSHDNYTLIVESHFSGESSISDLLKELLQELATKNTLVDCEGV